MIEGTRVRVTRGPHAQALGVIVSASTATASYVRLDGSALGADYLIAHDDLAPLPTTAALEQLIVAAQAAGADGLWLFRGLTAAVFALSFGDEATNAAQPAIEIAPPHELIVLIRFEVGDGGESGVEFRQ